LENIMIRRFAIAAFILAAAPNLGSRAFASAPNLLTYQGQLQESGSPVTGNRDVVISFCNAPTAGTCYATPRQTVAVANGLFRATYSVPGGVDLTTGNWWLDLQDGPQAGTLQEFTPREQFTSSAYALYASSVSSLAPTAGAGGVVIATNVIVGGQGTFSGGIQLTTVSTGTCNSAAAGSVQMSQAGFLLFCDGTSWKQYVSMSQCNTCTCSASYLIANDGKCGCPFGFAMVSGSANGFYYSNPYTTLDGTIGWSVGQELPGTLGITQQANLICCPAAGVAFTGPPCTPNP